MKRKPKARRPRAFRQAIRARLLWHIDARFSDFVNTLCIDAVRVRVELHGAADVIGVIVWARLDSDSFAIEQDKVGLKLVRYASVISISKGPQA